MRAYCERSEHGPEVCCFGFFSQVSISDLVRRGLERPSKPSSAGRFGAANLHPVVTVCSLEPFSTPRGLARSRSRCLFDCFGGVAAGDRSALYETKPWLRVANHLDQIHRVDDLRTGAGGRVPACEHSSGTLFPTLICMHHFSRGYPSSLASS